ncbi:HypC/HybG/HupF family hydrogenase formation chaperone [bacterium CG_4_10_14_0_2_um_filter_33_32]|nr:MAG: hypothetical protein AUJ93_04390 [bacterium CG2_30_33_46]PIR67747.1 MAG: HypC/HybG/HupF family hydrogenase formation chaperone [bacterium CG10_big_fil_rev_8_21_14_0_10_33_18]PIU77190.1 MAG: HypC/HybG/HupF family hydrogenase formation chaperone [bacterium CG06_land_8_20_14_3_00_33_50]PIW80990.1 MAG: HypC/HybG/HupF family hydrogenase formation chaperone [bacterium CG_4_8_14_3_um_filter_33_28]PIY85271.1 MAG: HypC/HybG/HupF family hydrogenase formation chaperone [bacterium CG_4_10_14_0_8_um
MCLGTIGKIKKIKYSEAIVDFSGNSRSVSLRLLPQAKVGNYILVHAGFAIAIADEAQAKENDKLIAEIIDEVKKYS